MSRRTILVLALVCLAVLATAIVPWTVTKGGLSAAVDRQLQRAYGVELSVSGRSVIAFLPVPRLKFENVTLSAAGAPIVKADFLRGEFRLLPLLVGRVELSDLSLSGAQATIDLAPGGRRSWNAVIGRLQERLSAQAPSGGHLRRIIVSGATLAFHDYRNGFRTNVADVALIAHWPTAHGPMDVTATGRWRGEPVQISATGVDPVALVKGQKHQFTIEASSPSARFAVTADATPGPEPRLAGRLTATARSLRDFANWSGAHLPLDAAIHGATLDGDFTAADGLVSWPAVRLTFGADRLVGALQARIDGGRLSLTGTLAADRLALPDVNTVIAQAQSSVHGAYGEGPDFSGLTGADLDLRLSAAEARVGAVKLEDVAANLLVKAGRIETSLGRATLHRGTIKGRFGVAVVPAGFDLKMQSSFDRVDLGAFLADLGQSRWASGLAQGQIVLEASGETSSDLTRQLQGRASLTVRQGELVGIGFSDVLKRAERRPLSAPLEWRGGRTPFDQAQVVLAIAKGVGEVVEGQVAAPTVRAVLQGHLSLVERTLALKATVEGAAGPATAGAAPAPTPSLEFDITGPWAAPAMLPDVRALIQRSGAARQLLGPELGARARSDAFEASSTAPQ